MYCYNLAMLPSLIMLALTPISTVIQTGNKGLVVGLCVFFLLVLPLVAVLVFFGYRHREHLKKLWARGPGHKYRSVHIRRVKHSYFTAACRCGLRSLWEVSDGCGGDVFLGEAAMYCA